MAWLLHHSVQQRVRVLASQEQAGLGYPKLTAPVRSSHSKLLSDALDEDCPVFVVDRRAHGYGRALPFSALRALRPSTATRLRREHLESAKKVPGGG